MSTKFVLFVIVMAVVALVSPAHGATRRGMVELGGSAAFVTYVGEYAPDGSVYGINTQVSYFTSDGGSVGGRLTFAGLSTGSLTESTLGLYATADAHLDPASSVVPFIGGAIGFERYSRERDYDGGSRATSQYDETDVIVEFHGGVKAFLRDNIAVTMEARYRTPLEDFADIGELSLLAGISVFLF